MITLYPFQREDITAMHKLHGRVLLAWEMGLGKGAATLAYMQETGSFPAVVVCPAGLKYYWQDEARNHFGMKAVILSGMRPQGTAALRKEKLFIINYEILRGWLGFLTSLKPKLIALDEVHYIASLRAKRTRAVRTLCQGVPKVIAISGTPLVNNPFELFPTLNILWPDAFPSPFAFGQRYTEPVFTFGSWQFKGSRNLRELHGRLKDLGMLRRLKRDVLDQLPVKRHMVMPVQIDEPEQYRLAHNDFLNWLAEYRGQHAAARAAGAEYFTWFTYIKHLAAQLKLTAVLYWLDTLLQETSAKILIGTIHRDITQRIFDQFSPEAVVIDGSKTALERRVAEERFRKSRDCRILVGQIKAAGVGLNLPEASVVVFAEFPWTPGAMAQFLSRAHRLTSTHQQLDIYHMVGVDTVEHLLLQIIQKKQKILDQTLDGVTVQDSSLTVWDMLEKALLKDKHP